MINHCHRLFALLLIVTVSLMPLRWGHTHQGLSEQQLIRHLQIYHTGTPVSELPQGWHSHADWPIALTESDLVVDLDVSHRISLDPHDQVALPGLFSRIHPGQDRSPAVFSTASQHTEQTYLRLNVLLV